MDLDAYVAAHRLEWQRLDQLLGRARSPRRLSGAEVDEHDDLYQRTATSLSVIQSAGRDPALVARLSSLVARARGVVAGGRQAVWRDVARFLREDFPAVCYRIRWWWLGAMAAFVVVATSYGVFIAHSPAAQLAVAPPDVVKRLVERDFADYYSSAPAQDFTSKVFTNNLYVAALVILLGIFVLPVLYVLYQNALNVGVAGGLMAANGRTGQFFGLILPHGMLELTAVFVACGLGLKLGWTVVDPGGRTRSSALAQEGRALVVGTIGLAVVLLTSGFLEGFVTPSGLPTWLRIGIGGLAEALFLAWVFVLGRRAHLAGVSGDLRDDLRGDEAPS
ncbi:MAG: hypothetical protein QOE99_3660 [Actinomycetota bacterium]|nr:hypothetical protein [Actinomycetota bacterium]